MYTYDAEEVTSRPINEENNGMNEFASLFFRRVTTELPLYDFQKCGKTLVRVKNDVMQTFTLKCYRGGGMCEVEFGVIPLCVGITDVNMGTYSLGHFEKVDNWTYDHTFDSMNQVINDILRYINEYLYPFFGRADSTQNALGELMEIERLFEKNRLQYLLQRHMTDHATPETKLARLLLDPVKYYIALKRGGYQFALMCHKELLKQNIASLHAVCADSSFPEEKILERKLAIDRIRNEVEKLEKGDMEYFEQMIKRNEAISIDFLKTKGMVQNH